MVGGEDCGDEGSGRQGGDGQRVLRRRGLWWAERTAMERGAAKRVAVESAVALLDAHVWLAAHLKPMLVPKHSLAYNGAAA